MMAAYRSKSLTVQINAAERQVLNRQQEIGSRTAALVRKIHRQMTAPATLLLAGGIGFIVGEFTKRQHATFHRSNEKPHDAGTSPLMTALNLMTTARTLYTALPLVWLMKSCYQPETSGQAPEYQSRRMVASDAAGVRRS